MSRSKSIRGFSLIEVLVAIALLTLVGLSLIPGFNQSFHIDREVEIQGQQGDVRSYIRANLSCDKTYAPVQPTCASGGYIELRRADGTAFVHIPTVGKYDIVALQYALRARCSSTNPQRLLIEAARVRSPSDLTFTSSPLFQGKLFSWSDAFSGIPVECPGPGIPPTDCPIVPGVNKVRVYAGIFTPPVNALWVIPKNGKTRTMKDGSLAYVAFFPPVVVCGNGDNGQCYGEHVKHAYAYFGVIIKNFDKASCQAASFLNAVGPRFGGGCFDRYTEVRMADGSSRLIATLKPGDRVWNPQLHKGARVVEVIGGPESDRPMYEIGYDGKSVLVTSTHPMPAQIGLKRARDLSLGDSIRGEDGALHPITLFKIHPPDREMFVFNLRLKDAGHGDRDHMVLANGLMTGDLELQRRLERKGKLKREIVP